MTPEEELNEAADALIRVIEGAGENLISDVMSAVARIDVAFLRVDGYQDAANTLERRHAIAADFSAATDGVTVVILDPG